MAKHTQNNSAAAQIYQIQVGGWFSERWAASFDGMTVMQQPAHLDGPPMAILRGPVVDQAALRGMLNKLWDLNLTLVSVVLLDGQNGGPNEYTIYPEPE